MLDEVITFAVKLITLFVGSDRDSLPFSTASCACSSSSARIVFKISIDPFVGTLSFLRVYRGKIKCGDTVVNALSSKKEKVNRLLQMHANSRVDIKEISAGDIVAAVGLKHVQTGITLCDPKEVITLETIRAPQPVISVAIEPATIGDQAKMADALKKLALEELTGTNGSRYVPLPVVMLPLKGI